MTEDGNANVAGAFAQFKYDFTNIISANIGLHGQYFGLNEEFAVEPRAGLQFTVHPQHVVNLGYGMHSRPEELKMYFMELNDASQHVAQGIESASFCVGIRLAYFKNWRFKVEGYYQHLYDIPGEEERHSLLSTINRIICCARS